LLAINDRSANFSLVAAPSVAQVKDLQGKRLYLTQQDSTRAYLAKGLLREAHVDLKSLDKITYGTTSGAGLIALQFKLADATFADDAEVKQWIAQHPGEGHILSTSRKIPAGMAISVLKTMSATDSAALLKWVTSPAAQDVGLGRLREATAADVESYSYIASLGILTPSALPGATVVSAKMAAELMQHGAVAVDTRTEKEYKHEHVAAAIFAPYIEKSLKETEFDPALDDYKAITALPQDKPLIFMCNGPECWKSYKASKVAITRGFKKVYWFRGGVPEWREQAMPLAHAAGG
jgi:rhodanese-related sulfurtransferase